MIKLEKYYCFVYFLFWMFIFIPEYFIGEVLPITYSNLPYYDWTLTSPIFWMLFCNLILFEAILMVDLYKRSFSKAIINFKWSIIILFLFPLSIIYFLKHGIKPRPTLGWHPRRNIVVFVVTAVLFSLLTGYGFFFFPQTLSIVMFKIATRYYPKHLFTMIPEPLDLATYAKHTKGTITYDKYQFEIGWSGIREARDLETKKVPFLRTKGKGVLFSDLSFIKISDRSIVGDLNSLSSSEKTKQVIKWLHFDSNYKITREMLNLTPRSLSIFGRADATTKQVLLLTLKPIYLLSDAMPDRVFSFECERIRGFQIGSPDTLGRVIKLYLFDNNDRQIEMWILFHKKENRPSQEDINYLIKSFKKVP